MEPIPITNLDDPRLTPYRSLRARSEQGEEIPIADGIHVVEMVLRLGVSLASLLVSDRELPLIEALLAERAVEVPVYVVPRERVSEVIGYRYHGGVMAAIGTVPSDTPLDQLGSRLVVLGALDKGENVGAIGRSALAFGFDGLLLDASGAGPYGRSTIRASRGAIFGLQIRRSRDLVADLQTLGKRGFVRIGAAADGGSGLSDLAALRERPLAVLLGNEGHGLAAAVRAELDLEVAIPLAEPVESLNVAAAAAIIFHALTRLP